MNAKDPESLDAVKRFFRKQIKKLHPDLGGDKESFIEFLRWYEDFFSQTLKKDQEVQVKVVKSPEFRGRYVFSVLELTVEEVALGGKKKIEIPAEEKVCSKCNGTGHDLEGATSNCGFCKGRGIISTIDMRKEKEVFLGCPYCKGKGKIYTKKCEMCRGKGRLREKREILIDLPLGLREGDYLWISSEVAQLEYDIYLEIMLKEHPYFYLEDENLIYRCEIPFWEVMLNEHIKIRTLEGEEEISSSLFREGKPIVLKNRGPFFEDGRRGNLVVDYRIYFPRKIPFKVRCLIEEAVRVLNKSKEDL